MRMPMKRSLSLHFLCVKLIMIVAIITSVMTKSSSIGEHSIAPPKCTKQEWQSKKFRGNCDTHSPSNELKCFYTCRDEGVETGRCMPTGWCNCYCKNPDSGLLGGCLRGGITSAVGRTVEYPHPPY
ncbi:hypothetical protein HanRHA438_Chr17g0825581 [Helianthus annuus]|nr:hypothetical protein HanRHA438_Chr17g0825581 [Helianthus annuus]